MRNPKLEKTQNPEKDRLLTSSHNPSQPQMVPKRKCVLAKVREWEGL